MTFVVLLELVLKYAPEATDFIGHLVANIAAGRSQQKPTDADWAELDRLGSLSSEAIYKRLGVTPPPPLPT